MWRFKDESFLREGEWWESTSIQGSIACWPITKARSKKIKEALNGLIQEIWVDSNVGHSKFGPKEDEGVINLIQAIEG